MHTNFPFLSPQFKQDLVHKVREYVLGSELGQFTTRLQGVMYHPIDNPSINLEQAHWLSDQGI